MTCIAAVAHLGAVYMAADTGSVMGGTVIYCGHKLIECQGLILGFAGQAALVDQVAAHLKVEHKPSPTEDLRTWMGAIAEAIAGIAANATPPITDESGHVDGVALAGYRGELWMLSQQAASWIDSGYYAIGSGRDLALGYLTATVGSLNPEAAVQDAVRCAAQYDPHVNLDSRGPQLMVTG